MQPVVNPCQAVFIRAQLRFPGLTRNKKAGLRRLFRELLLPSYFSPRTKSTSAALSASLSFGLAGIGIAPHTPPPPLIIFGTSLAFAPASPLYFLATSAQAGPTTFLSI